MTLYEYLNTLTSGGSPLVWSWKPLSESQVSSASGEPYVRVIEREELAQRPAYGDVDVMSQMVDVNILQAPTTGATLDRTSAMSLYYSLLDAPGSVTENVYSHPLIDMQRVAAIPPNFDEETTGLWGNVRFRLLFARGQ